MNIKRILAISVVIAGAVASGGNWQHEILAAKRWEEKTSGEMTISNDAHESGAVRFDTEIPTGKSPWIYPLFRLKAEESLADAVEIHFEIKVDCPAGVTFSCLQAGGKMLPFPNPDANWKKVKISLKSSNVKDWKNVREFQIGFNPAKPGKSTFWLRNFKIIDQKTADIEKKAIPVFNAVKSPALANVFFYGEEINFNLRKEYQHPCFYLINNAYGKEITSGSWPSNGVGTLTLKTLPCGYYTLMLRSNIPEKNFKEPLSFAVVAQTTPNPESYFCIDTAQSWLCHAYPNTRFPGEKYELTSELCRRAGVGLIRDRFSWFDVEKNPGNFEWGKYKVNADYLKSRGVQICSIVQVSPLWAKSETSTLPKDLLAVYNFAKKAEESFNNQMIAWEYWNEPDGHIPGPVWEFAASTKAASLGFKAANPDLKFLNASFCIYPLRPFVMQAFENGILDYIDAFNYHIYKELTEYPAIVKHLRETLTKYGAADMPIWITENGTKAEGVGTEKSYMPNLFIHSPEQEMLVAEFLPKSQILLQSLGISRDFFFALPAFNESKKDWGLLRRDQTVKPGYVAFANLNHQLSHSKLLGEVYLAKGVRAFLYKQPDNTQTIVLWSESRIDQPKISEQEIAVEIPQATGEYRSSDIFGTEGKIFSQKGKINIKATRYPLYINGLSDIKVDRAIPPPPKVVSRNVVSRNEDKELAIVLRPVLGKGFSAVGATAAEMKEIPGEIKLQVWNLSPNTQSGKLTVTGAKVQGLPQKIKLEPFEKQEFSLKVIPDYPKGTYKCNLNFGGIFSGKKISPLNIPLMQIAEMPSLKLDYRNPKKWNANSSGKMEITYDGKEDAIRFRTKFASAKENWVYPEYLFGAEESLKNAGGVCFEIKAENVKKGFSAVMAVLEDNDHWLPYSPCSEEWETRVIPFEGFDVNLMKKLRIGMNPVDDDFTYLIRNVKIYYDHQ